MYYQKKWPFLSIAIALPFLFGCQKSLTDTEPGGKKSDINSPQMLAATVDLPGRTLAANCFQCHGTNGYASELKIANMDASEISRKFAEFKAESPRDNIMNLHAYAYTPEEIQLIGEYFANQ
jgi:sulfide dehydrogenase cytochrome subunit